MTRISEAERYEGEEVHFLPCEGGCGHYLRIEWDNDPEFRLLYVEAMYRADRFGTRVKRAWKAFRGRDVDMDGVLLNAASIDSLLAFLNEKAAD